MSVKHKAEEFVADGENNGYASDLIADLLAALETEREQGRREAAEGIVLMLNEWAQKNGYPIVRMEAANMQYAITAKYLKGGAE